MTPRVWIAGAALFLGALGPAPAQTGSIRVTAPWVRATPKSAPVVGGYATITNTGTTPDRLVGASLEVAATGEIHTMSMSGGVMHMARVSGGLAIAPGATLTLAPGGDHLMFLRPKSQLSEGAKVGGTLIFEKAGTIPVTFAVAGMAAKAAPGASPARMQDMPAHDMPMQGMPMH